MNRRKELTKRFEKIREKLIYQVQVKKIARFENVKRFWRSQPWRRNCHQAFDVMRVRIIKDVTPGDQPAHAMGQHVNRSIGIEPFHAADIISQCVRVEDVTLSPIVSEN